MLQVENISCVKGSRFLFKNLSFKLDAGQMVYLEGANGAGKTTLLRVLCGLATAEQGQILWHGEDIHAYSEEYSRQLVYLGHHPAVKDGLTVLENLRFSMRISGVEASNDELRSALKIVGLGDRINLISRFLSQGQKRRLALSRLWLDSRPIWILDEPFTALDVQAIQLITNRIDEHLTGGGLVVMTSHQPPALSGKHVRSIGLGQ